MKQRPELEVSVSGTEDLDVKLVKKLYKDTDQHLETEAMLYKIKADGADEKEFFISRYDSDQYYYSSYVPGWCRKDKKRDKKMWKKLKQIARSNPVYDGALFAPLPQVKEYQPKT